MGFEYSHLPFQGCQIAICGESFESFLWKIRCIAWYLIPQLYSKPRERIVLYFQSRIFNIEMTFQTVDTDSIKKSYWKQD